MRPGLALVTGAGRRLGRAMALDLARQGWSVAVHYNGSEAEAASVAVEARAMGVMALIFQADLLDATAAADLVPRVVAAFGRPVSLLVNNASIFEHDTLATATPESWHRHMGSNLQAPFLLTQAFAAQAPGPGRDAAGEPVATGLVVNMIDQRVLKPTPEFMTYSLAKMALWGFTRTAAQALAPGVRVNAIGPGPAMQGTRQSPGHFAAQRAATILERGTDPAEICAALAFLIRADGMTGQLICLDGGQHLAWRTVDILGVE